MLLECDKRTVLGTILIEALLSCFDMCRENWEIQLDNLGRRILLEAVESASCTVQSATLDPYRMVDSEHTACIDSHSMSLASCLHKKLNFIQIDVSHTLHHSDEPIRLSKLP